MDCHLTIFLVVYLYDDSLATRERTRREDVRVAILLDGTHRDAAVARQTHVATVLLVKGQCPEAE